MNPGTGEVICEVQEGDKADVDAAVGVLGLLQPFVDRVELTLKETVMPLKGCSCQGCLACLAQSSWLGTWQDALEIGQSDRGKHRPYGNN